MPRRKEPKKILIVDDDPHIVLFLRDVLEDGGYSTCIAANGVEALDVARRERPALITLDIEMPKAWGPRFCKALADNPQLAAVPIVVISGLNASRHAVPQAAAWLAKPVESEDLLRVVRNLLG